MARPPGRPDRLRGVLATGIVLLALWLPDVDFVVAWILPGSAFAVHGGATHSLVFALGFAAATGLLWRVACGRGAVRLAAVCFVCVTSHAVLDALTWGRGVMLLWPWTTERIASPVLLFVGVHRSQPYAWMLHAATIANEAVFVGLVWVVSRRWDLRRLGRPRRR